MTGENSRQDAGDHEAGRARGGVAGLTPGVTVITGAGQGIGRALAQVFARAGAAPLVLLDRNLDALGPVAADLGAHHAGLDVSDGPALAQTLAAIEDTHGPIGTFISNAGVAWGFDGPEDNAAFAEDEIWQKSWEINVLAHVRAARWLLPRMIARGGGTFVQVASAAGLLNQIGSAVYGTTKHAAVGFAENLAISHRHQNIRVALVCPQGVATPLLDGMPQGPERVDGLLSAEAVAEATLEGLLAERFLILPHPQVQGYIEAKAQNTDRWIAGMSRLQDRYRSKPAP